LHQPSPANSKSLILSSSEVQVGDIPKHYRKWNLSDYEPNIVQAVTPFLLDKVKSLFIYSETVGSRKTSLAAAVLKEWRRQHNNQSGGYFAFITPNLLQTAALDFVRGKQKLESWKQSPIVVLDDIGAIRNTPHIVEQVAMIVSARYDRDLPIVATSNRSLEQIAVDLDARLASRLQEGTILCMGNTDWRAK
jgi:chromosomal replication initiation ATPase DnaA